MVTCVVVVFDIVTRLAAESPLLFPVAHPGLIPNQLRAGLIIIVLELTTIVSIDTRG